MHMFSDYLFTHHITICKLRFFFVCSLTASRWSDHVALVASSSTLISVSTRRFKKSLQSQSAVCILSQHYSKLKLHEGTRVFRPSKTLMVFSIHFTPMTLLLPACADYLSRLKQYPRQTVLCRALFCVNGKTDCVNTTCIH